MALDDRLRNALWAQPGVALMGVCLTARRTQRFPSVEEAWFWTMAALRGRRDGTGGGGQGVARPCDPDDIILCLDRLYRARHIDSSHAAVLRAWGERQFAPGSGRAAASECRLWLEAMACLAPALRAKGIVE